MWCHFNLCVTVFFAHVFLYTFVSSSNFKAIIPCTDDVDCSEFDNGTCSGGACKCSNSHLCETKQVKVVTKIGEKCNETEECNIENSECRKSKCLCKEGYVKSTDGRKCLTVSNGIPGSCEDSVQCYTKSPDSVCINNECVCDGMHEFGGKCYKNVGLGQACQSDPECSITDLSVCRNQICSCKTGFVASTNGSRCLLAATGNKSPCVDDTQCTATLGDYSYCKTGFCKCNKFYHYKEPINKCIQDMLLGDHCTKHSDCHDPDPDKEDRLECIYGVCQCRSFFKNVNGICVENSSKRILVAPYVLLGVYVIRNLFN